MEDPIALEQLAIEFYKNLFNGDELLMPFAITNHFPSLSESAFQALGRDLSNEEILCTMKSFGAFKHLALTTSKPFFTRVSGRWLVLLCVL